MILKLNNIDLNDEITPQITPKSSKNDYVNFILLIKSINLNKFCPFGSNIQSINAKFNELQGFILDLESSNINFGIV